jgi:hypothetical protein
VRHLQKRCGPIDPLHRPSQEPVRLMGAVTRATHIEQISAIVSRA